MTPGFHEVFSDDFNSDKLPSAEWNVYDGRPNNEDYTIWRPDHVWVDGGALSLGAGLKDGQWLAGGLAHLHGAACERYQGACPSVGTPDWTTMDVDWVKIWSYS